MSPENKKLLDALNKLIVDRNLYTEAVFMLKITELRDGLRQRITDRIDKKYNEINVLKQVDLIINNKKS